MDGSAELAGIFQTRRGQLRAMAYRLLGSASMADDAVQETWLRLTRVDAGELDNIDGWLRTVLTRICLDMLRARRSRREDLASQPPERPAEPAQGSHPENEAVLADSVGRALLVVLDTLNPAERIAFVLHDMFAVPFDQIAPIVERSPVAAKKLASRARRKVQGAPAAPATELAHQRQVVSAFLAAGRAGDLDAILAVLSPDVVRRVDTAALPDGVPAELHGARAVAEGTVVFGRRSRYAEVALVDGTVGAVVAPHGRLWYALTFAIDGDRITEYNVIADPARLRQLEIGLVPDGLARPHDEFAPADWSTCGEHR